MTLKGSNATVSCCCPTCVNPVYYYAISIVIVSEQYEQYRYHYVAVKSKQATLRVLLERLSVHPSVCPVRAPNSIGVNFLQNRSKKTDELKMNIQFKNSKVRVTVRDRLATVALLQADGRIIYRHWADIL